ncbi:hypothetical protein WICANDRAFT_84005 [Wickerhamomyces anomalus NRRL Y-366-8]|uniref:Uncharacterized protein n=1 Tax=Wickerhamomyces anomalus (strain ATCC 58044 / CBS 1984 / NCYC 433 / NRRL Y-366-8) TaxID=683960 RepID=A0A1E3P5C4_WICAA|nr:uncharacterized protein WICANDRAFT_84005 [Wickerhamomyces anomalus NRRL Y-366-8]ODQ60027.1 hypothetical protein WICANDRAFT_84005 [Wickerhamomyces anomalus NRRL Y-366-8]
MVEKTVWFTNWMNWLEYLHSSQIPKNTNLSKRRAHAFHYKSSRHINASRSGKELTCYE